MISEQSPTADLAANAEHGPGKAGRWERFVFDPGEFTPPIQPIYDGLLARGDLAIWLGREKHRKSSVLLQFAICAALGRNFLHFLFRFGRPVKVVLLDYESKTQSLKQRYDAIVESLHLNEDDRALLRKNLWIVEMRKAFRHGLKFARFPVRPDRGDVEEFSQAENEWRSFVRESSADLYIIDPMRCMHAQAENDSALEALLTRVHLIFGEAAVVISHHLRKRDRRGDRKLKDDMRVWADEARGSGTITAHADVIVCQERVVESAMEMLHLGAYLRDGADIEPMALRESANESFLWIVAPDLPEELIFCLDALRGAGREFQSRTDAVTFLQQAVGAGRSTSFSRVKDLISRGYLIDANGALTFSETPDRVVNTL